MSEASISQNHQESAKSLGVAGCGQSGQALIVQTYALGQIQQPELVLASHENLRSLESNINQSIRKSKDTARLYLDHLLPQAIQTTSDLNTYLNLNDALLNALKPDASKQDAVRLLSVVRERVEQFKSNSQSLQASMRTIRDGLAMDGQAFSGFVHQLNTVVKGDTGVLASLDIELADVDGKINGEIYGAVVGGLGVLGGGILIAVGGLVTFATAGVGTGLIFFGVAAVATGLKIGISSAVNLNNLYSAKSSLLQKQSSLKDEVRFAQGHSSSYRILADSAAQACVATQQMINAWSLTHNHLQSLISNIEAGRLSIGILRELLLASAQADVKNVRGDIATIQGQLLGVKVVQVDNLVEALNKGTLAQAA